MYKYKKQYTRRKTNAIIYQKSRQKKVNTNG